MTYNVFAPKKETPIKPKIIIGFDTETIGDSNTFILGTIYTDREQKVFYNKIEMQEYLLTREPNTYIVASNLQFDFNVIFHDSKYFYNFQIIINGGRIITAIYEDEETKKETYFIDTYNYIQGSVDYYGKILGIPKLEKPQFLGSTPQTQKEWKQLEEYCMRDSEITYKFTRFLQENYNTIGTPMKLTSASTSKEVYQRKYLNRPIYSEEKKYPKINEKLFQAYYGGRTEIFNRGYYKNMNYYDFNSLYPSCMMEEYPDPDTAKFVKFPSREILEYDGVSNVSMTIEDMSIPILPVYYKKLLFPVGNIKGTYTHLEIRKAIEQGYTLKKINWTIYYKKTFQPFKTYIEEMYDKRKELKSQGNPAELVYKLLMNSLYGKFAEKNISETKFIDYTNDKERNEMIEKYPEDINTRYYKNDDGRGYMIQKKICTSAHVRPIFSIYTTAYGRLKLWSALNKYGGAYCDTDSIVTKKSIEDSKVLGHLKLETFIRKGIFVKPKCYTYTDNHNKIVVKLKGVPRSDEDTFTRILENKSVSYMKFTKIKESVKKGIIPNTKMMMTKDISLEDNKRLWTTRFNPYFYDEYSKPHFIEAMKR